MQRTRLGRSDIEVSKIGVGAMQATSEWGAEDKDIVDAIYESNGLGVNLVDTAEGYGNGHSETVVGRAIARVGRERLVIATKVAGLHLRYDDVLKACRGSLQRLGVKQIDVYQIHSPNPWEQIPLKHTMRALERLYDEGKIRAIGVSNFAVRDMEEARSYLSKTDIVSNQVRYNLLERQIEEEVIPYCTRNKIAVLAWSPLAQGALTGKYGPGRPPGKPTRSDNPLFFEHNLRAARSLLAVLKKVGRAHERSAAQVALHWLGRKEIVIPIPGARNASQARQNAMSLGWRMSAREAKEIEEAANKVHLDYFPR